MIKNKKTKCISFDCEEQTMFVFCDSCVENMVKLRGVKLASAVVEHISEKVATSPPHNPIETFVKIFKVTRLEYDTKDLYEAYQKLTCDKTAKSVVMRDLKGWKKYADRKEDAFILEIKHGRYQSGAHCKTAIINPKYLCKEESI